MDAREAEAIESAIGSKVIRRLVLPCALFILIGAIDRTNVGFAALEMNAELGLTGTQYGFGAGVLFVGYVLAKYPSVLLFEAWGMRRWLATITLAWGLGAAAMAAIANEWQLYVLRVFIGFAEGGLSSGLMIYLSSWATERHRATILAVPIMAIPIAQVIGAPVSGVLIDGFGWRMMFLLEALPALALGIFALLYFPDRPEQARWLSPAEREWLATNVKGAAPPDSNASREGRWDALKSPVGWIYAPIWFCILASNYGVMFWLPQMVKGLTGLSATETGLIVALPNAASAVALVINARHSDRTQERIFHVAVPALAGGAGLLAAYLLGPGLPGLLMLIVGGACTGCTVAAFWAIPTKLIEPRALAMGIVAINMLGSMAGATIPPAMGLLKEASGSFFPPTALLAAIAVVCAALCLAARSRIGGTAATATA